MRKLFCLLMSSVLVVVLGGDMEVFEVFICVSVLYLAQENFTRDK